MAMQTPATSAGEARQVKLDPTEAARERLKCPRNAPCPCGSGKKYKKCCLRDEARFAARHDLISAAEFQRTEKELLRLRSCIE